MTLPAGHGADLDVAFAKAMQGGKYDATLAELGQCEEWHDGKKTLMFCLFANGRLDLLYPLLEAQKEFLETSEPVRELLNYAVYRLDKGIVRYFASWGVPLHEQVLFHIVHRGEFWEFVLFLIDLGADPMQLDRCGNSLLHAQAHYGMSKNWVRELVNYGVPLELKNRQSFTALQEACSPGNITFARTLIEAGADKTKCTENGATLLHLTCYGICPDDVNRDRKYRRIEMAQFLLEEGIERAIPNNDGKTPLDFARHFGHEEIVEILSRKSVK